MSDQITEATFRCAVCGRSKWLHPDPDASGESSQLGHMYVLPEHAKPKDHQSVEPSQEATTLPGQLRGMAQLFETFGEHPTPIRIRRIREAADALDEKDRRIAELEAALADAYIARDQQLEVKREQQREIERLKHKAECLGCPDCKGIPADKPCDDYQETPRNFCKRCGLSPLRHV